MEQLPSLIFIDGGDPKETAEAKRLLGHIDGQTTNPTLVVKNPDIQAYLKSGKKLTKDEALAQYKKIVLAVAQETDGPISIQVIADHTTSKEDMLLQARVYKDWIPNGVIKFPCVTNGLAAAQEYCVEGPVNITLNFSQSQSAAVYQATRQARHRVFVSPFVGRLDDKQENGMDVVVNTLKMFESGDSHVAVLTASVRTMEHLHYALYLKSPAITVPFKIFQEWAAEEFKVPAADYHYNSGALKTIPYQQLTLDKDWHEYDLHHDLTDAGLKKFMEDWNSLF